MKPKTKTANDSSRLYIAISVKDRPVYEKIKQGIINVLKKFGGYEPEADEILIDQIASSTIYSKNVEVFLDSDNATQYTYSRVADVKAKFQKMIESAFRGLALSRCDRLNQQGQSDLINQLREAILAGRKKE